MSRPFDAWSPRAKGLARPFTENAFRLLELEPGAQPAAVHAAVRELSARIRSGRDTPRMLATGPSTRTAEQVEAADAELALPASAARHALFVPWLRRLTVDGEALPEALSAILQLLLERADPVALVAPIAHLVLPGAGAEDEDVEGEPEEVYGGRLFAGDLDLAEVLGAPPTEEKSDEGEAGGFLDSVGRAPSKVADALLAATRLGTGRRLHASYLRTLLAQADGGDPSARRRVSSAKALFEEVESEPGAPLVLGWREFLEGNVASARKRLTSAARSEALTPGERARAQVLLARIALAKGEPAPWLALIEGLEAQSVRGALALHEGNLAAARASLDAAWELREGRPRLAPLLAQVLLAQDDVEGAARVLESVATLDGSATRFAKAWLAHAQGELDQAVDGYRSVLALAPKHLGANWGVAALSEDAEERAQARSALEWSANEDSELALALLELALQDGAIDEISGRLDGLADDDARDVKVVVLDRLGRRAEAWKLRAADEDAVRDEGRKLLEQGDADAALHHLAGVSMADPLRRRAARAAVLEALTQQPDAEPDDVVARVLGKVSADELALLDLPAHLYRAIRELENGERKQAIASLRRHLDSAEDALAARLFEVLNAPANQGWPALTRFLELLLGVEGVDVTSLTDAASESDDEVWEAAVIAAAAQGAGLWVGEFEGGSQELQLASALCELRAALLEGDWSRCADALRSAKSAIPRTHDAIDRAERAIALARFPEAVYGDPELAIRALGTANDEPSARAHDLAVWRHFLAIGAEDLLGASQLVAVVQAWSEARTAGGLVHPGAVGEASVLEDELLNALAALVGTIGPDRAEAARAALLALDDELARRTLERAGWSTDARRRGDA